MMDDSALRERYLSVLDRLGEAIAEGAAMYAALSGGGSGAERPAQ